MPKWRPPCDASGKYICIWNFPLPEERHKYDSKGPYLSLYSELEANKKQQKDEEYWPYAHWTIAKTSRHDGNNYKFERSIDNTFNKRRLDDWFEPGTPRQ